MNKKALYRTFAALLLLLTLLLCGCAERSEAGEEAAAERTAPPVMTPEPTPEPTEPPITPQEQSQRVKVSYKDELKNYLAEGSNDLLLTYRNRIPVVELPGLEQQQGRINAELIRRAEQFRTGSPDEEGSGLDWYVSVAAADYAQHSVDEYGNSFVPCAYERDCSTVRGDGTVLSFLFSEYSNSGGVHGYTGWSAVTFDPETGEVLTLADLAEDPEALRSICLQELRSQCAGMAEMLYDNYESYVDELYAEGLWYLNDRGLVFISNAYHLAPYAAGTLSFTVRYKTLKGVLQERYQLPPRDDVQGGLEAFLLRDVEPMPTEPELAVSTDGYGEKIVLSCFNSVYNIRLFTVNYDEPGGSFYQKQELMYLSALRDGEYVLLQSSIPDVIPNLQLSWRLPDGTTQRYLISQSGKDGSILLVEPNTIGRIYPGEVAEDYLYWDLDGDGDPEVLELKLADKWELSVSDGEKVSAVSTPLFHERPRLIVADVDEDNRCEIFLQEADTLHCWRYNGSLESVSFLMNREKRSEISAQVLQADGDGLLLSCAFSLMGSTVPVTGLFRDGEGGTLSLAYGRSWEIAEGQQILLQNDLPYTLPDGSGGRLSAGTVILPVSLSGDTLCFTTESGLTAYARLN